VLFIQKDEEEVTLAWRRKETFSLEDFLKEVNAYAEKHGSEVGGILNAEDLQPRDDPWPQFTVTLPLSIQDFQVLDVEPQKITWLKFVCNPPGVSFWFDASQVSFAGNNLDEVTDDDIKELIEKSSDIDSSWLISTVRETITTA